MLGRCLAGDLVMSLVRLQLLRHAKNASCWISTLASACPPGLRGWASPPRTR